ncbi:hypothetical protein CCP2SC5_1590005 [Azospirillaceae bacterium]
MFRVIYSIFIALTGKSIIDNLQPGESAQLPDARFNKSGNTYTLHITAERETKS